MATVINTTPAEANTSSSVGIILALILLVALAVLFFIYGLPFIRGRNSGTEINVPDQIDVNVDQQ